MSAPSVAIRPAGGDGAPVVLLLGFGADGWCWWANQAALGAAGRIFLADLPGHGASSTAIEDASVAGLAAAVGRALDDHGLSGAHLVGHSLGGAVALCLADARPDIASLTLIAPAGLGGAVDAAFLEGLPELKETAAAEALLRRLVVRPRLINGQMVAHVLGELEKPGRREALRRIAAAIEPGRPFAAAAAARIAERGLPRLMIWGEADAINALDPERLTAFGGETLLLPETGHMAHVEAAPSIHRAITGFLGRLGTGG